MFVVQCFSFVYFILHRKAFIHQKASLGNILKTTPPKDFLGVLTNSYFCLKYFEVQQLMLNALKHAVTFSTTSVLPL